MVRGCGRRRFWYCRGPIPVGCLICAPRQCQPGCGAHVSGRLRAYPLPLRLVLLLPLTKLSVHLAAGNLSIIGYCRRRAELAASTPHNGHRRPSRPQCFEKHVCLRGATPAVASNPDCFDLVHPAQFARSGSHQAPAGVPRSNSANRGRAIARRTFRQMVSSAAEPDWGIIAVADCCILGDRVGSRELRSPRSGQRFVGSRKSPGHCPCLGVCRADPAWLRDLWIIQDSQSGRAGGRECRTVAWPEAFPPDRIAAISSIQGTKVSGHSRCPKN